MSAEMLGTRRAGAQNAQLGAARWNGRAAGDGVPVEQHGAPATAAAVEQHWAPKCPTHRKAKTQSRLTEAVGRPQSRLTQDALTTRSRSRPQKRHRRRLRLHPPRRGSSPSQSQRAPPQSRLAEAVGRPQSRLAQDALTSRNRSRPPGDVKSRLAEAVGRPQSRLPWGVRPLQSISKYFQRQRPPVSCSLLIPNKTFTPCSSSGTSSFQQASGKIRSQPCSEGV